MQVHVLFFFVFLFLCNVPLEETYGIGDFRVHVQHSMYGALVAVSILPCGPWGLGPTGLAVFRDPLSCLVPPACLGLSGACHSLLRGSV